MKKLSWNHVFLFLFTVTKVINNKIRDSNMKINILAHLLFYRPMGPHNINLSLGNEPCTGRDNPYGAIHGQIGCWPKISLRIFCMGALFVCISINMNINEITCQSFGYVLYGLILVSAILGRSQIFLSGTFYNLNSYRAPHEQISSYELKLKPSDPKSWSTQEGAQLTKKKLIWLRPRIQI